MAEASWQASEEVWLLARSKLVAKDFAAPSDERVVDARHMDHIGDACLSMLLADLSLPCSLGPLSHGS